MVTLIKYGALSGGEKYNVNALSLDGLSTDTKPIRTYIEYGSDGREVGRMGIPNGSLYTEIDTGDTYMYDADNTTWHKVSLGGGGGGGGGFTPTTAQLAAMNSGITSEDVEQIATNENNISLLNDTIYESETIDYAYVSDITGVVKTSGMNGSPKVTEPTGINVSQQENYDTYYVVFADAADIYVELSEVPNYLAITYGNNYTGKQEKLNYYTLLCSNPNRVRKSDNNLPTSEAKLHISSGDVVAFTITTGQDCKIYGLSQSYTHINPAFKMAVSTNYCYCKYVSGTGVGYSTERLEIYQPARSGFIKYNFVHTVKDEINADIWRVENAVICNENLIEMYNYTTAGEWECAVRLDGRSDFSGGAAHGDEITEEITLIVDGEYKTISSLTELTPFYTMSIFQSSKLYDPSNENVAIADHGSEHKFDRNGLELRQNLRWLVADDIIAAYMAMFPVAKANSNKLILNDTYTRISLPQTKVAGNVTKATLYSDTAHNASVFEISKYPEGNGTLKHEFMCTDNDGGTYNKCYFVSVRTNTYTTSVNEIWDIVVNYYIDT